jgi:hypothetical protein
MGGKLYNNLYVDLLMTLVQDVANLDLGRYPELPERFRTLLSSSDEPRHEKLHKMQDKKENVRSPNVLGTLTTERPLSPSDAQRSLLPTPNKLEPSDHPISGFSWKTEIESSTPIGRRDFHTEPVENSPHRLPTVDEEPPFEPWPRPPRSLEVKEHLPGTGDRPSITNLRHRDLYELPEPLHNGLSQPKREQTPETVPPEPTQELVKLLEPALLPYSGSIGERCVQLLGLEKNGRRPDVQSATELDKFLEEIRLERMRIWIKQDLCRIVGLPGSVRSKQKWVEYAPRSEIVEKSKRWFVIDTTLNEDVSALCHTSMNFILKWAMFPGMPPRVKRRDKYMKEKAASGQLYRYQESLNSPSKLSIERAVGGLFQGLFYSKAGDFVEIECVNCIVIMSWLTVCRLDTEKCDSSHRLTFSELAQGPIMPFDPP